VRLAQAGRDDQLRQLGADGVLARMAERLHRRRVEVHDQAAMVHRDHAVEARIDDRRLELLGAEQQVLGAAALDELADLAADRAHQLELVGVGHAHRRCEELHHAEHAVAAEHRQADAGAQPRAQRDLAAREVRVALDVGDPRRLAARPDAAGRPTPGSNVSPRLSSTKSPTSTLRSIHSSVCRSTPAVGSTVHSTPTGQPNARPISSSSRCVASSTVEASVRTRTSS
jgi:hypothetical protein